MQSVNWKSLFLNYVFHFKVLASKTSSCFSIIKARSIQFSSGLACLLCFLSTTVAIANEASETESVTAEQLFVEKNNVAAAQNQPGQNFQQGKLVIIIDDIGNHYQLGMRALELPGKLSYAFLPKTPQASRLAKVAANMGAEKEVLLHMPMEAIGEQILGPAGLYNHLSREEFGKRIDLALREIPNAVGLSNHMGSYLTQQSDKMDWVMAELSHRELYFLDSRTAGASSARQAANEYRVPYIARDHFLDHHRDTETIRSMFERAVANARRSGMAVLIGHPYRSTLSFLEAQLPGIESQGIQLVTVSEAIKHRATGRLAALN